jgi:serine protease Do
MKTSTILSVLGLILLPFCLSPLLSQVQNQTVEKKVTIIKRSIEADGTELTETIVKKGKAAENFDVDKYLKENTTEKDQVEVIVNEQGADDWSMNACHNLSRAKASCSDNGAFLGVQEDSDEDPDEAGLVVEITRGSAAEKAGLRDNDKILKLNNSQTDQWDDLADIINNSKPGDKLKITYSRNGKVNNTEATLITRKDLPEVKSEAKGFLGVSDEDSDEEEAGVAVSITNESAAEKAGLEDGDIILKLNDTPVSDFEDISDFMAYTKPGEKLLVTYERNGKTKTAEAVLGQNNNTFELSKPHPLKQGFQLDNLEKMDFDFPNLNFTKKEKEACLGVYSNGNGDKGSTIGGFTELSAAKEVGMLEQDIILSVNGNKVNGHSELWDEIAKYKTGDKVDVAYLRNGNEMKVQATLKACRDNQGRVEVQEKTLEGINKNRRFYTWNWEDEDNRRLRETKIIIIRRAGEGDAAKVNVNPQSAAPALDRSLKLESFKAFPNPSQGQVTVEFRGEAVPTVVSLLDISGRQLFSEELNAFNGEYNQLFDLTAYAKGTIVIQVTQGEKVYSEQILVN